MQITDSADCVHSPSPENAVHLEALPPTSTSQWNQKQIPENADLSEFSGFFYKKTMGITHFVKLEDVGEIV